MTARAYVLIETKVGNSKNVVNKLKELGGVKYADVVTGPYDVIALVESDSLNDLGALVTGRIHPISGISRTVTCLTIRAE